MQTPTDPRFEDLTGQKFHLLTVLEYAGRLYQRHAWLCICDCGETCTVSSVQLKHDLKFSCGCYRRKRSAEILSGNNYGEKNRKHGGTHRGVEESEFTSYRKMIERCYNTKHKKYAWYGGRGVKVYNEWHFGKDGKHGYEVFLEYMGRKSDPKYTIDRYPDPDGNYEPGNVRWASRETQRKTQRQHQGIKNKSL